MDATEAVEAAERPATGPGVGRAWTVGALLGVLAAAALAGAWAVEQDHLEVYYAASVRSMAGSWHAFAFGAFDPAATVTLDKLPGAFWVQALAARLLGVDTWTLVLPQVLEGLATIVVLYLAVAQLGGRGAGLVAAAAFAVTPAVTAENRGNIADPLLVLMLVLAAHAVAVAIRTGRTRWVLLAGLWIGLGFQAKMLEAWFALPALGLGVLVAAPGPLARRVGQAVAGGAVAAAVSLAWIGAVSLLPADGRPAVDGSTHNSLFEMVFGYNGFGRLDSGGPLAALGNNTGLGGRIGLLPPSWHRLLTGDLGRDIAWLLPAAVVAAAAVLIARRRAPRTDPERAGALLWTTWLLVFAGAFSTSGVLQPYYTATLAPAVAALVGLGAAQAWRDRGSSRTRLVVAATVAGTACYAVWLLSGQGEATPGWLPPAVGVLGLASVALAVAGLVRRSGGLPRGLLLASGAALLIAPATGSALLAAAGQGPFDTAFENEGTAALVARPSVGPTAVRNLLARWEQERGGAPYLVAFQSSLLAAPFAYASGEEVFPIGGATGDQPHPTVDELRAHVARGDFHQAVVLFLGDDPRAAWIAAHCAAVGQDGTLATYRCEPADAG